MALAGIRDDTSAARRYSSLLSYLYAFHVHHIIFMHLLNRHAIARDETAIMQISLRVKLRSRDSNYSSEIANVQTWSGHGRTGRSGSSCPAAARRGGK